MLQVRQYIYSQSIHSKLNTMRSDCKQIDVLLGLRWLHATWVDLRITSKTYGAALWLVSPSTKSCKENAKTKPGNAAARQYVARERRRALLLICHCDCTEAPTRASLQSILFIVLWLLYYVVDILRSWQRWQCLTSSLTNASPLQLKSPRYISCCWQHYAHPSILFSHILALKATT